jgi:hypothetical protein
MSDPTLCAILKATGQIFWLLQRMPLSPSASQTANLLPNCQKAFVTENLDSFNMDRAAGQFINPDHGPLLFPSRPHIRLDGPFRALIEMHYAPA